MGLSITWTRTALKLPDEVREELSSRLERLSRYFPEMRRRMKVGITRSYDGLVFQSDDGDVKLMLEVLRRRDGSWKLPTYWTMAHELMHLAQFNSEGIPSGERACDVHALARVPPRYIDDSPSYLVVPRGLRGEWTPDHAGIAHRTAKDALEKRRRGLRTYASWWEATFEERVLRARAKGRRAREKSGDKRSGFRGSRSGSLRQRS